MQTTTALRSATLPTCFQGILSVQVRNRGQDYGTGPCLLPDQQNLFYKTLDQIDRWYAVFKEEANNTKPNVSSITKKRQGFHA